jgi:hypothetical protein
MKENKLMVILYSLDANELIVFERQTTKNEHICYNPHGNKVLKECTGDEINMTLQK